MNKQFVNVMQFWRDVEALSPRDIPRLAPEDPVEPVKDWRHMDAPPWLDETFRRRRVPPKKVWRHTVFACQFERSHFITCLEQNLGAQPDVYEERLNGTSCVFAVTLNEFGVPIPDTFSLSMAAWACGIIENDGVKALSGDGSCNIADLQAPHDDRFPRSNTGYRGFDTQLDYLRQELAWRVASTSAFNSELFYDFAALVIKKCRLQLLVGEEFVHRTRSLLVYQQEEEEQPALDNASKSKYKKKEKEKPETQDDLLNSFFIKDLKRLSELQNSSIGNGLRRFVGAQENSTSNRVDVRQQLDAALDMLSPDKFPEGCWPSAHPLVWSQQLAMNELWSQLGSKEGDGVFAVNGPPGTGKTTLLRDIVAAIVVERAKSLSTLGASALGSKSSINIGNRVIPFYNLNEAITGFSIVVASSNNGAVENVSLELPKLDAIHRKWDGRCNTYPDIATQLIGQPAWSLISGRLGNKRNRNEFVNTFWFGWNEEQQAINGGKSESVHIPGLMERLNAISDGKAPPTMQWEVAVAEFNQCLTAEREQRTYIRSLINLESEVQSLDLKKQEAATRLEEVGHWFKDSASIRDALSQKISVSEHKKADQQQKLEHIKVFKPGLLDWLATLGKSHRRWQDSVYDLISAIDKNEVDINEAKIRLLGVLRDIKTLEERRLYLTAEFNELSSMHSEAKSNYESARQMFGDNWPIQDASIQVREKSSPWFTEEWMESRIRLFLSALHLHQIFVESNSTKMVANLRLSMDVLKGVGANAQASKVAFDSLSLICPVISTTFASVQSIFRDMGKESIGWLLIDEAGQAQPQAAAGAIWRARRSIVVGDPLQLEPVVTLPRIVETALSMNYGNVDSRLHPSGTSVQKLVDSFMRVGTWIGEENNPRWVGAPLRVHRRCDEPMFSIFNSIAYDDMMVHHKEASDCHWPPSSWLHVSGDQAEGHWIPAEGIALEKLLIAMTQKHDVRPDEIFLVSPFKDVVKGLKRIGKKYRLSLNRIGTVHTTQGKESDVVIIVLGGGSAGARAWAASKPNLLNVATSRAKKRLYVIGDCEDWGRRKYFDVMRRNLNVVRLTN